MSSVLHKTTKQLIPSVNTPDYMDGNWIINPDLSAVVGIPTKYWAIDTIPAVPAVYETLTDPETLEQYQSLVSEAIPESYVVREMTVEEKAIEDSVEETLPDYSNVLISGVPAFYDSNRQVLRAVNEKEITFSAKTPAAKNFFLNIEGLMSSNLRGYLVAEPAVLLNTLATIQSPVDAEVYFDFIDIKTDAVLATCHIMSGNVTHYGEKNVRFTVGMEIGCFVRTTKEVTNPVVRISFATTN
jgi:hypothetical protein